MHVELNGQLAGCLLFFDGRDRNFCLFFRADNSVLFRHESLFRFLGKAKAAGYPKLSSEIYLSWWARNWGVAQAKPPSIANGLPLASHGSGLLGKSSEIAVWKSPIFSKI
jgi:hypothetical protein